MSAFRKSRFASFQKAKKITATCQNDTRGDFYSKRHRAYYYFSKINILSTTSRCFRATAFDICAYSRTGEISSRSKRFTGVAILVNLSSGAKAHLISPKRQSPYDVSLARKKFQKSIRQGSEISICRTEALPRN